MRIGAKILRDSTRGQFEIHNQKFKGRSSKGGVQGAEIILGTETNFGELIYKQFDFIVRKFDDTAIIFASYLHKSVCK